MAQALRVAMLLGGRSAEREVSLVSGGACAAALRDEGYEVVEVDAQGDLAAELRSVAPDVAFNALHGRWGEDGCVQGLLECLSIPYTHSGVLASAIAMDKPRAKAVFSAAKLPIVEDRLVAASDVRRAHPMPPPYVVKPANEGSSVGVYIVPEGANRPPDIAKEMPDTVMVERYVPGHELTVSVLGDRALQVTEILTEGWYDYAAKYRPGGSRHVVPAEIPREISEACRRFALAAHQALGCRGLTRSDFRWDAAKGLDGLVLIETNTQPGMTPTSLSPEQAAAEGIGFGALCRWIVEDASCNR